jgi:hypothetical protein
MGRIVVIYKNELLRDDNGAVLLFETEEDADSFVDSVPDVVIPEAADYSTDTLDPVELETEDGNV